MRATELAIMIGKKTLIGIAALLAAILVLALVAPFFIDIERHRERLAGLIGEALGRKVTIAGPMSLRLMPSIRVRAGDVALANASGVGFSTRPMATLAALDIELALLPLLGGRIEVSRFLLRSPDILLERAADGRANWQFSAGSGRSAGEAAEVPAFSAERMLIEDGRLVYRDAATGSESGVEAIGVDLALGSLHGPFDGNLTFKLDGQPWQIGFALGDLALASTPVRLDGALRGKPWHLAGTLAADGTRPGFSGDISLGGSRGSLAIDAGLGARTEIIARIDLARLDLADFVAPAGKAKTAPAEPAALPAGPFPLALPSEIAGRLSLSIDDIAGAGMALGPVTGMATLEDGVLRLVDVEAAFDGGGKLAVSGTLRGDDAGNAALEGRLALDVGDLHRAFGLASPAPRSLHLEGRAGLAGDTLSLADMVLRVDDMRGGGRLGYRLAARPAALLDLDIEDLDLAPWMPAEATSAPAAARRVASPGTAAPAGLPALAGFDADLIVEIGRIRNGATLLGPGAIIARLAGGTLEISRFAVGRAGEVELRLGGRIKGLAERPDLALDLEATARDSGRLFALAGRPLPAALAGAGALRLAGTLSGTVDAARFKLAGGLGGLVLETAGDLNGLAGPTPRLSATFNGRQRSLAALAAQFGSAFPNGSEARPVAISGTVDQAGERTESSGSIVVGDGRIDYNFKRGGKLTTASLDARAPDFRRFLRDAGVDYEPAGRAVGSLDVSLALSGEGDRYAIAPIRATIGPVALSGSARADLAGAVPRIDLVLDAGDMPIDDLLPPPQTGVAAAAGPGGARWSDAPIDLAAFDAVDGSAKLTAKSLTIRGYRLESAVLEASLGGRRLAIEDLGGRLYGGTARVEATLDGTGVPQLETAIALSGVDLDRLMTTVLGHRPASGTLGFSGSYKGRGVSERAILASLEGSGHFGADRGVIRDVDLVALDGQLGSLRTVNDFVRLTAAALGGGETAYRHVGFDLPASKGSLRTENFAADIDGAAVEFSTAINLPAWTIDGRASFALAGHPDAPPVEATVKGGLGAPEVAYQTGRLKQWAMARFGTAVIRGVTTGEGVGIGNLLFGDSTPPMAVADEENAPPPPAPRPAEEIGNGLIRGLFGRQRQRAPDEPPS